MGHKLLHTYVVVLVVLVRLGCVGWAQFSHDYLCGLTSLYALWAVFAVFNALVHISSAMDFTYRYCLSIPSPPPTIPTAAINITNPWPNGGPPLGPPVIETTIDRKACPFRVGFKYQFTLHSAIHCLLRCAKKVTEYCLGTKTPIVWGLNGDVRVPTKGNLRLGCKVSGNPLPRVEWFRNGKRLKNRGRVTITTRRQTSRLEIRRVSHLTDGGYYECRAMNVVSRQPSVARQRVIITSPSKRRPYSSSQTSSTSTRGPLWPQVRPCPIPSFCLNGGTCTLYEAVGECADGYMGQRCESKDIYLKLTFLPEYDQRSGLVAIKQLVVKI
ncbi:unnamed protein product [Oppiella nova]|uniref:Ig-like domain-containing protein n=1 Tax=Oppiella nova TaxID=334625 RepID=A0A7R9LWL3_9ACAR|nr:unnamed protein product [Oppiella nova]CAG2167023.1 unnamed protein product [Oppiella nova]